MPTGAAAMADNRMWIY